MAIVVWGLVDGFCLPYDGKGFRKQFSSKDEAEYFIKYNCTKIKASEAHRYTMYITDEYTSLDSILHHHNWKSSDSMFRDTNNRIEEVNILEIKELVDLEYKMYLEKQNKTKLQIEREVKSMNRQELLRQAELISKMTNIMKGR